MILDDHPIVASGVEGLLNTADDIKVVGISHRSEEFLEKVEVQPPDLALLDVRMDGSQLDGLEVAERLRANYGSHPKLLMLTAYTNPEYVLRAISVGVDGYLLKTTGFVELIEAIRRTCYYAGQLVDPVVQAIVEEHINSSLPLVAGGRAHAQKLSFTNREQEVLALIGAGLTYPQIAAELFIAVTTVRTHAKNIMAKLKLRSRQDVETWYRYTRRRKPPRNFL